MKAKNFHKHTTAELKKQMYKYTKQEDYLKCALIRDELKSRKNRKPEIELNQS